MPELACVAGVVGARAKWIVVAAFASAFLLGFASVALAADAYGAFSIFYGPVKIAGTYLCGGQQAGINNSSEGAFLTTTGWSNSSCSNSDSRPAGQLGAIAYLWKGTSGQGGVLYAVSPWTLQRYKGPKFICDCLLPGFLSECGLLLGGQRALLGL